MRQPIGDGRHFRRCRRHNVMTRIHDTIRDLLHLMATAAGLASVKEPLGLLRDNPDERPADWYINGWKTKSSRHTKHAMDLTLPLSDSAWDSLTNAVKHERATMVGATGRRAELTKKEKVGSVGEQTARGNDDTMNDRCERENIHFWPVALEGDGVPSESFMAYINDVCDAAQTLTGANRTTFKSYFLSRISNTLHQVSAHLALRQTAACRARLLVHRLPSDALRTDVDFRQQLQQTLPAFVSQRQEWRNRNSNQGLRFRVL